VGTSEGVNSRLFLRGLIQDALDGQKTGGLTWHFTAWLSKQRWSNTKQSIEEFLLKSPTQHHRKLILIGGSAGWMMSSKWLSQFEHIELVDIDPLAPFLFRIRHQDVFKGGSVRFHFDRRDGILELPQLLKQHPEGLVWFDNVLGQQCYRFKDEEWVERQLKFIKTLLKERSWGSVHDLLSGPVLVDNPLSDERLKDRLSRPITWSANLESSSRSTKPSESSRETIPVGLDMDDFDLPHLIDLNGQVMDFQKASQALLSWVDACGIWQDHLSAEVFPLGDKTHLIAWPFKSKYCHWLQAGFCNL
jgi:hypothetical protein